MLARLGRGVAKPQVKLLIGVSDPHRPSSTTVLGFRHVRQAGPPQRRPMVQSGMRLVRCSETEGRAQGTLSEP
ncbi:MAG: hypothetical protein ACRD1T_01185, partial [Acidimicrobiia bacterium]